MPYQMGSDRRVNMFILSTKKYVIKSLHGDIFLWYEFILRFGKFIALDFVSYDKFAYPKNSNHVTDSIITKLLLWQIQAGILLSCWIFMISYNHKKNIRDNLEFS